MTEQDGKQESIAQKLQTAIRGLEQYVDQHEIGSLELLSLEHTLSEVEARQTINGILAAQERKGVLTARQQSELRMAEQVLVSTQISVKIASVSTPGYEDALADSQMHYDNVRYFMERAKLDKVSTDISTDDPVELARDILVNKHDIVSETDLVRETPPK